VILEEISVLHRTGQWCPGVRTPNGVLAYDVPILLQYQAPGRPTTPDRCFVLPPKVTNHQTRHFHQAPPRHAK
jgi:hypothetical protein